MPLLIASLDIHDVSDSHDLGDGWTGNTITLRAFFLKVYATELSYIHPHLYTLPLSQLPPLKVALIYEQSRLYILQSHIRFSWLQGTNRFAPCAST